jgi:hypothetical protein
MQTATEPSYNRIAIVFDFDDTLAPNSYSSLLDRCDLDIDTFLKKRVQPLIEDGWDEILAKFYCLIEESHRTDGCTITRQLLADVGREIKFFNGVPEMFDRLRTCASKLIPDIDVEFYLLSSGILEIVCGTPVADEFKTLWGCEFHFDHSDEISFIKRTVSHPEKTRYMLQLAKGVSDEGDVGQPAHVYRNVPTDQWHVPLEQVIYVGDGSSDMPVFALMKEHHGIAIGVYKSSTAAKWGGNSDVDAQRRVENLAPVDYSDDGELMRSLRLAVESICKRIALRQLSKGE